MLYDFLVFHLDLSDFLPNVLEKDKCYIFDENVQMLDIVLLRGEDGGVPGHYGI